MQVSSITAQYLACRRGDRLLFRGLDLQISAGTALHITGHNGVGKSSLIRILAGLLRPYEGSCATCGSIALVDEHLALDQEWPLGKALAFWEKIDNCANPNAARAAMGIEHLLDVPVRFLSTGQRKRANFTRLLNAPRDIWLLDEPFNGLDSHARVNETTRLTDHLASGGICIIAAHHPLDLPAAVLALEDYAP